MSWKASLSRHLPILRFFACPSSPSSRGVMKWYETNYEETKMLNPSMPLLLRTTENAMPAITTELDFKKPDLLKYMLQTGKFRDPNGTISEARVEAAKVYLAADWAAIKRERWACPGFDPENPLLYKEDPDWKSDPDKTTALATYLELKNTVTEAERVFQSGPNNEYRRAENALLMCQRVDLWCAGEAEVESAVKHLLKLGQRFNDLEPDYPEFVTEFYPGVADF